MIVVRPIGGLSEPSVLLVETPDLVHHGVRGGLREGDGQGHVVIVILNMGNHSSHKTEIIVTIGVKMQQDNFRSL